MTRKILNLLSLSTTKNVIINTSGNYLNVVFAGVYSLIMVRVLSPHEYGVLSILFACIFILANVFDFGVTASIYSYLPTLKKHNGDAMTFIKTNLIYQTSFAGICTVILFFTISSIDAHFLKLHIPYKLFALTLISIPLFLWQNYILNTLYALNKFLQANIALNSANIVRLILIIALTLQGNLTIETSIVSLLLIGPIAFFFIIYLSYFSHTHTLMRSSFERKHIRLGYTLTFFAATQVFNVATRADLFLISYFLSTADAGYYGLSQKITAGVLTAITAVTQVLSPQFASIKNKRELSPLFKKSFFYTLIPIGAYIGAILMPREIYTLAFTHTFAPSIAITRFLSASYILYSLASIPVLFFLYTIRKPLYLLVINTFFLGGVVAGSMYLIPRFGVIAPAIAIAITLICILIFMLFAYTYEYQKLTSDNKEK